MLVFLSRGEAWEGLGVRDREGRTDSGQEQLLSQQEGNGRGWIKWRKIASSLCPSVSHSPGVGFNGLGRVVRNRSLIPNCVPLESREGFYFRMFWATHEGSGCLMNHQLM